MSTATKSPQPGSAQPGAGDSELSRGLLAAAIAVTTWGASTVIAKVLPQGGLAIAAYRFLTFSVIIGAWRLVRRNNLTWAAFTASIPGGLLLAADVAFFFTAIKLTAVVNATIIGALQPLLLTAYGVRFLGEKVRRSDIALGLLALGGVILIVLTGSSTGEANWLGDLAAVGALLSWSGYFIFAKRAHGVVSPSDYTLSAALIVGITNVPLALMFGQSLAWPSTGDWGWFLLMALGAGLLGHNMMNWSIARIPLWLGATMTLLVPIVSSAIAWVALDESLEVTQMIGMAIAVLAIGTLVKMQSTGQTTDSQAPETETPEPTAEQGAAKS